MAEHIDLGSELADYGGAEGDDGAPRGGTLPTLPTVRQGLFETATRVPLAELQAAGFNTTPPPGFGASDIFKAALRSSHIDFDSGTFKIRLTDGAEPLPDAVVYGHGRLPEDWQRTKAWVDGDSKDPA